MPPEITKEQLYAKFDKDVKKRSRIMRLLLVTDQFFNVLFWNGSQDETMSSNMYRRIKRGACNIADRTICNMLKKIEKSHCFKSRGE